MGITLLSSHLRVNDLCVLRVLHIKDGDFQVAGDAAILIEVVAKLLGILLVDFCHDLVGVFEIASAAAKLDCHLVLSSWITSFC